MDEVHKFKQIIYANNNDYFLDSILWSFYKTNTQPYHLNALRKCIIAELGGDIIKDDVEDCISQMLQDKHIELVLSDVFILTKSTLQKIKAQSEQKEIINWM